MDQVLVLVRRVAGAELVPSRTVRRTLAVLLFAALTALGAYARVPLAGDQVPVTLQMLFVLLAGALLGPELGAASQVTYLMAGIAGLPVFAGGVGVIALLGPTGGYLLAFPIAAWVVGRLAGRGRGSLSRLALGLVAGTLVVYAVGAVQLAVILHAPGQALALGVAPFLVGDAVKIVIAALIAWRLRPRTLEQL